MAKAKDPIAALAEGIAADETLRKNAEGATTEANPFETDEPHEAVFLGDFDSFDAARKFIAEEDSEFGIGDMTVVNGALVRWNGTGFDVACQDIVAQFAPPADHVEGFNRTMVEIERVVLNADFESGPLLQGTRDVVIGMFKALSKIWTQMSQAEQRQLAKETEKHMRTLIKKITRVVVEGEQISVTGKLESFNCKGGFDLKISAPGDEDAVVQLYRMTGHEVVIISADSERFLANVAEAETLPDEPELFADRQPAKPAAKSEVAELPAHPEDDSDLAGDDDEEEDGDLETGSADDKLPGTADDVRDAAAETVADLDKPLGKPSFGGDDTTGLRDPNAYESRSNPDDEPFEATEEELAKQDGRKPAKVEEEPAADFVDCPQPEAAVPGQTWLNPSDPRIRHKHPNGKWYLSAPTAEAMEEYRASLAPAPEPDEDDDTGFPSIAD